MRTVHGGECAEVATVTPAVATSQQKLEQTKPGKQKVARPCRDYLEGGCKYGDACRFRHGEASAGTAEGAKKKVGQGGVQGQEVVPGVERELEKAQLGMQDMALGVPLGVPLVVPLGVPLTGAPVTTAATPPAVPASDDVIDTRALLYPSVAVYLQEHHWMDHPVQTARVQGVARNAHQRRRRQEKRAAKAKK
jgi:hypothetical protein